MASAALATETLTLKTVVSIPGGKITSFDISFVDPGLNYYILGDRTNKAVQVINTVNNTIVMSAGQGIFKGATSALTGRLTSTSATHPKKLAQGNRTPSV